MQSANWTGHWSGVVEQGRFAQSTKVRFRLEILLQYVEVSEGGWQNIHEKTRENIQKPRGQSRVGKAHEGLPPRFLDILSSF